MKTPKSAAKSAANTLKVVGDAVPDGFTIEDGIPLPLTARRTRPAPYFPLEKLKLGQSFFVPKDKKVGLRPALRAYYAANPGERGTILLDRQGSGRDADVRVFKREAPSRK